MSNIKFSQVYFAEFFAPKVKFSQVYFENLISRIDCAVRYSKTKDPFIIASNIKDSECLPNDLDPSFNSVANTFVIECLGRYADITNNYKHLSFGLFCPDKIVQISDVFILEFLKVYINDHRTAFEFNARDFLRCFMTRQKPCELGQSSFDEYFSMFYDQVLNAYAKLNSK